MELTLFCRKINKNLKMQLLIFIFHITLFDMDSV